MFQLQRHWANECPKRDNAGRGRGGLEANMAKVVDFKEETVDVDSLRSR